MGLLRAGTPLSLLVDLAAGERLDSGKIFEGERGCAAAGGPAP